MRAYDPNLRNALATHVLALTFQAWNKRAVHTVRVSGNCLGASNLDVALNQAYDNLPTNEEGHKRLALVRGNSVLYCDDEEGEGERWLGEKLVKFEIVAIEKLRTSWCPTCKSRDPKKHPAMQSGGEVQLCSDKWHTPDTGTHPK